MKLDRAAVRKCLTAFDFATLFREHLGWDKHKTDMSVLVDGQTFVLTAVAQKRGFVAYSCPSLPDRSQRLKIDHQVTKSTKEHFVIYCDKAAGVQVWHWVRRETGKPAASRDHRFETSQPGDRLIQRLEQIAVSLKDEEALTLADIAAGAKGAFDIDRVTKRFYDQFKKEHAGFLKFINGIENQGDLEWYTSLMLNRLMFVYFIQKKGFLDDDTNYLRNRLRDVRALKGKDKFQSFYRYFLLRLFHDGLGQAQVDRKLDAAMATLLGKVPYLNGGFFEVHQLEERNDDIDIPDNAFEKLFDFFDQYSWHLDERELKADNEINPDVVGYIFEKYINQKQMGAYYTKEDITEYVSKNTIIPFLFDAAAKKVPIAFEKGSFVWRLLADNPDKYVYESVRRGVVDDQGQVIPLPNDIEKGVKDVATRDGWNRSAPEPFALPTETWREHVSRRERCLELRLKLKSGEVSTIGDLVTLNLDIWQFARDAIVNAEGPEVVRAFWEAIERVTVLDPTCGSGAFLFAALRILETLYSDCLEGMRRFAEDHASKPKHPEQFKDFEQVLAQVNKHPNEKYFVLKSIIIGNLYGVDIMEEAVEICKLRLFLKLVAQVDKSEQIEPLPDIDFNIRAGNTLVGYATKQDVRKAFTEGAEGQRKLMLGDAEENYQRFDEDALAVEGAFRQFRREQTRDGGKITADDKRILRGKLSKLNAELDRFLADEYGVPAKKAAFDQWKSTHQPFHWFVEFYGIIQAGGFDVVVGNPPYVEYREVIGTYRVAPALAELGNLHGMVAERSLQLRDPRGTMSMIVPVALSSTERFRSLREKLGERSILWLSHFDFRPSKLFEGAEQRLTIFVSKPAAHRSLFTTRYNRWYAEQRSELFKNLVLTEWDLNCSLRAVWPKLAGKESVAVLRKVAAAGQSVAAFSGGTRAVYYKNTGMLYWTNFTRLPPTCFINGKKTQSSRQTEIAFRSEEDSSLMHALLNSSLFYVMCQIHSNCRDLNPSDIGAMRFPDSILKAGVFGELSSVLHRDQQSNSSFRTRQQRQTGEVKLQSFYPALSKPVVDEIDELLAQHYGFAPNETDLVTNYDVKFRMGAAEDSDEE